MSSTAPTEDMRRINGMLQAGQYRDAHDKLEAIVIDHPDYAEARRLLGGTKLALGDAPGAERVLRGALALDPDWTPTLATLGEWLLGSGRFEEAEILLRRAATGKPPHPHAALVLARYFNDTRRPADALEVLAPHFASGMVSPDMTTQHVAALVALGRAGEAVTIYRHAAETSPHNEAATLALTVALQASNRHEEAERVAGQAIEHGARAAALHHAHGRSLTVLKQFERAEAALDTCARLQPARADAHADLARLIWMRTGDSTQATASLDAALHMFPNDDALWAAKAAVLQGAGDARAAYACLAERAARPHAPPALLVRAGLAAMEFDSGAALDLAQRALKLAPADASARKLLVAALLGVGDAAAALPVCDALLRQAPDDQYLIALQTTARRMLDDERYARLCDYARWVVPYRLEAPKGWSHLADFLTDLKGRLDLLHDALRHPLLFQSLRHGTETTEDLAQSKDPVIHALFEAFDEPIRDYIGRIGHGDDPLPRRNKGAYQFNGSWSVRLREQGFHHNHVHPRGWISSACYIELPDRMTDQESREGILTFAEPGILTTPLLPPQYDVRPSAGMLVLFPSYFWHGTVPFSGEQTRLTVAFDAVPGKT
jgi:tetratricopeptide (TPR) repeat protein